MKTRLLIIIGIVGVLTAIVGVSVASPSINNFDDFVYQLNEPFDGAEPEPIAQPESEPRISGKMVQEICSITGGECSPNYPANVMEDGSEMTIVTTWDAETNIEKSFVFIIKNNTLSYDVHIIDKDVHSHPFDTRTDQKQYHVDPIYIENPNTGGLVLDVDSMQQVLKILDWCHRDSLGHGVLDIGLSFNNETHYIDNNICEWQKIK